MALLVEVIYGHCAGAQDVWPDLDNAGLSCWPQQHKTIAVCSYDVPGGVTNRARLASIIDRGEAMRWMADGLEAMEYSLRATGSVPLPPPPSLLPTTHPRSLPPPVSLGLFSLCHLYMVA